MEWFERAECQSGVVSREQMRVSGVSNAAVSRMVAAGALRQLRHGVFLVRGAPTGYQVDLWIAVLATEGTLGFATAAHLWGLDTRPDRIHVIVGRERRVLKDPALRRHHVPLPECERTWLGGLPVTSKMWTLLDHLGRLPRHQALRLADRALQRGWLTREDIAARVARYPGRQGNVRLRMLLDWTSDGAAAESERLLHGLLRRARVRGWKANYPIEVDGRVVAVADVAVPAQLLAIEIDGFAFHSDLERFQRDRERQNLLVGLGWTVLRFTWHDLVERPDQVIATIVKECAR